MTTDWIKAAACNGLPVDMFFPASRASAGAAIDICHTCPVIGACYTAAQTASQTCGVWGGEYWDHGHPRQRNRTPNKLPTAPNRDYSTLRARRVEALAYLATIRDEHPNLKAALKAVAARYGVTDKAVGQWERDERTEKAGQAATAAP